MLQTLKYQSGLDIKLIGMDDNLSEVRPIREFAKKQNIKTQFSTSSDSFMAKVHKSSQNDILVSDNNIKGTHKIIVGDRPVDTNNGVNAGIVLLTQYCEHIGAINQLRVIFTQFSLHENYRTFLKDKNVHFFRKEHEDDLFEFKELLAKHVAIKKSSFMKEKTEYVFELMDEWELDEKEKAALFGLDNIDSAEWEVIRNGDSKSKFTEQSCDLIYRLKLNLVDLLNGEDIRLEAKWLKASMPEYDNHSPLEYVSLGDSNQLIKLVESLEKF